MKLMGKTKDNIFFVAKASSYLIIAISQFQSLYHLHPVPVLVSISNPVLVSN